MKEEVDSDILIMTQASILAPVLFNMFISDMTRTTLVHFGYADDLVLAVHFKIKQAHCMLK